MTGTSITQLPSVTAAGISDASAVTIVISDPATHADYKMTVPEFLKLLGFNVSNPQDGDLLKYDAASQTWKNAQP